MQTKANETKVWFKVF